MAARSVRGVERVLTKLEASINAGNYYEAHQMYRTLYFRYLSQRKFTALLELLRRGANVLLDHDQQSSGADLAILYVDVLGKSGEKPNEANFVILSDLLARMRPNLPERENYLCEALRWSTSEGHKYGHPSFHRLIAQAFWKEKNYALARHHFLHSTDGKGCATMLVELHRICGYANEVDLFIAQAVLQYLCLQNKSTATVAFNCYTTQHPHITTGPPYILPLLNFIWFLLKAIESGELVVFTVLCEKYQPSILRDPTYPEYLGKIGEIFFGETKPQQRSNGLIGDFIQSFFTEDSDVEEGPSGSRSAPSTSVKPTYKMETEDVD